MQTQRDKSNNLSEVDSLKLENTRLMARITELEQIVKEKSTLEAELKQIIEENAEKAKLRDAKLNARIIKLERSAKLEQNNRLENGDNTSENHVCRAKRFAPNIHDPVLNQCIDTNSKSLEDDTVEQTENCTDDVICQFGICVHYMSTTL